jgi:hypothetical protein
VSVFLVWIVTVLYLGTAVSLFLEGNKHMSLVFLGYALANVGIILSMGVHPSV